MSNGISAFDRFWSDCIFPSLTLCEKELDEEFKKEVKIVLYNDSKYKEDLRYLYKNKREWLKREYLPNEHLPLLDFHKLSSIVCRVMIGLKPFAFDSNIAEKIGDDISRNAAMTREMKLKWQIDNVYVNYKAAFLVAEGITFIDLLFWTRQKINDIKKCYNEDQINQNVDDVNLKLQVYNLLIDKLNKEESRLYHYEPTNLHDDFFTSSIIALMKNDYLKRDFDYLQFSISMFQWQEHTKKQLLYDILLSSNISISLIDLV